MHRIRAIVLSAAALLAAGCGETSDRWKAARPATTPASGLVTFQGKPLAGAIVVFHPTAPNGIGASALTNEDGKFELKTFPPDLGAVPGSYSVSIMKTEMPTQPAGGDPNDPGPVRVVSAIPVKYSLPDKSGLHSDIPASGTDGLRFELGK